MKKLNKISVNFLSNRYNIIALYILLGSMFGILLRNNLTIGQFIVTLLVVLIMQLLSYVQGMSKGMVLQAEDDVLKSILKEMKNMNKKDK